MATLAEVRVALAQTITAGTGLRAHATVPGSVTAPCASVIPERADFDVAMGRGWVTFMFTVRVEAVSQDQLDAYLAPSGAQSLYQALHNLPSLGLEATTSNCSGWSNYGGADHGGTDYLAADLAVEVTTRGTA